MISNQVHQHLEYHVKLSGKKANPLSRKDLMIAIIDYQMGNLGAILNMLKKIGADAIVTRKVQEIEKAEKLIFPGVGAFDNGVTNLQTSGILPALREKVLIQKIPVLGICLGMQLLTERSEEGILPGLGWIEAKTIRFRIHQKASNLKVPHMGWNTLILKRESTLFKDFDEDGKFYFIHSYHILCNNHEDVLAETHHGYDFVSAVQKGNIFGVQFHPEKSHKYGMRILRNFAEIV